MKKLYSLTFYAMVTPILTFGASSLLAQDSTGQNNDRDQQNTQRQQGATGNGPLVTEGEQNNRRPSQSDSRSMTGNRGAHDQSGMQRKGYMSAAPMGGMQASDLMDAEVETSGDEDIGQVHDLIIDQNGQIVAIVVGVGGFLGMGEKDVAIGWDDVKMSRDDDDMELYIDVTREDLLSAPEYEDQD